jgi:magnesium-transporting ATPase (P-type)
MKVEIFGKEKSYKLLQKFEFSSDRKKMSVVIQDEATGLIFLYSKGADLAIFDRLSTNIE